MGLKAEVKDMNISFFIHPKKEVAYLYDNYTIRQGLEKLKHYGYTAIPVLSKENKYMGTISEGDLLWTITDFEKADFSRKPSKELEQMYISEVECKWDYPCVTIDTSMEDLLQRVMNQNFVPVVDDRGVFIGIITRRDVIHYFMKKYFGDDKV